MDAALTAFLITLGIIGGICSPLIVVAVFGAISNSAKAAVERYRLASVEAAKSAPFDDAEVNVNPSTNVMTVRLIRKGKTVWQGASSRRDMEVNEILTFNKVDDDGR